jgi:hypothetical protein
MMVSNTQDYWVFGLRPLSGIQYKYLSISMHMDSNMLTGTFNQDRHHTITVHKCVTDPSTKITINNSSQFNFNAQHS